MLLIAAPAPRTDPPQAWTIDAGPSTRCSFFPLAATSGSQLCSAEQQTAMDMYYHWEWANHPSAQWSHRARRARKVGPGSRPLPEGIEVCCRSQPHDSGAWAGPVPNPTTHCRHCTQLSEKPASAMHRSWSSGRRSLSERPSTRCSNSRAVPAPGSAGPEGCPARHASPSCGHEEKSLSNFFS